MKSKTVIAAIVSIALAAFAAPPSMPGGGGGTMPGGGEMPGGGGAMGGAFAYDAFISVTTNSDSSVSRNGLVYGYLSSLTDLRPDSTVKMLADGVFAGCATLKTVDLSSSSITAIPSDCFAGCTALVSVTLPSTCTSIGSGAFAGCTALVTAEGSGLASIGSDAFRDCTSLATAPLTNNAVVGVCAFANCPVLVGTSGGSGGSGTSGGSGGSGSSGASSVHPLFPGDVAAASAAKAISYTGYVLDGTETVGTVLLKVGRANGNTGVSSFKATVKLLGEKKRTYSAKVAVDDSAPTAATLTGTSGTMALTIASSALYGEIDGMTVVGARNLSAAKESRSGEYAAWKGVYNVVLSASGATGGGAAFASGYSSLAVAVLAKGRAKVSGTMADGTKVSVSGLQLLLDEGGGTACVPVVVPMYKGKLGGFGFLLWIAQDGTAEVSMPSAWDATVSSAAQFAANLECVAAAPLEAPPDGTLEFTVDATQIPSTLNGLSVRTDLLPSGIAVTCASGRMSAASGNAARLRISRVAGTGLVKGSFAVFTENGSRLKKTTVKVYGAVVDGAGYGTAVLKKVGAAAVTIGK